MIKGGRGMTSVIVANDSRVTLSHLLSLIKRIVLSVSNDVMMRLLIISIVMTLYTKPIDTMSCSRTCTSTCKVLGMAGWVTFGSVERSHLKTVNVTPRQCQGYLNVARNPAGAIQIP